MDKAKTIGLSLLGLLVALILLHLGLRLLSKVPGVGKIAQDAQSLSTSGQLA